MAQWLDATIAKRIDWNDHLFSLSFSCPEFTGFKAGQFTKVGVEQQDGKVLSRPYSLVNPPAEPELEIIAVPVAGGLLSPHLHALQVSDKVKIMSPATGYLILDEVPQAKTLWMIATGTGIGPFLSMLSTMQPWQSYQHIVLVYAVRWTSDLAYLERIKLWQQQHSEQFTFVPVVSRELAPGALRGRIPALLQETRLESAAGHSITPDQCQVMLCGNPEMIKDTMALLKNRGMKRHLRRSPGQITMEQYW